MTPENVLLLIFSIGIVTSFVTFLPIGIGLVVVRNKSRQREQTMRQRFPNARLIIPSAMYFGQQSKGIYQMRGNGTLVLTDQELVFERLVAHLKCTIPLDRISAIETPRSFLGKSYGRPLLKVVYRTESGEDAIGWYVRDLASVKAQLEQTLPKSESSVHSGQPG